MKVIDISWPISQATTGYKDKHIVAIEDIKHMGKDGARETAVRLSSHTGTHVDAPSHFLKDGLTIDQLGLDRMVGPCKVIDMTLVQEQITRDDLIDRDIEQGDIILFKTTNSDTSATDRFSPRFVYLEISGARYLVEKKVKAVGIDYLGIERAQQGHLTHIELMQADIVIIEGLRLKHVSDGSYFFVCLPLAIIGTEAAPARAILLPEEK